MCARHMCDLLWTLTCHDCVQGPEEKIAGHMLFMHLCHDCTLGQVCRQHQDLRVHSSLLVPVSDLDMLRMRSFALPKHPLSTVALLTTRGVLSGAL